MKVSCDKSWHNQSTRPTTSLHNLSFYLQYNIRWVVSILMLLVVGCTSQTSEPATPGPPATANGQAVLGWGGNSGGQIGDGSTFQRLTPSLIELRNIQTIAAGGDYSLALTSDGHVLEWGGGKTTPIEVAGLASVKQITAGEHHRLALKEDGTVWAWGENNHGQLGDGSHSSRTTPVQVVSLNNVVTIAAGGDHSLAIRSDFGVWAWGSNSNGELGDNTKTDRLTPVVVPGIQAIEIAASSSHSVALTTDLKLMGWGSNTECQLGVDPRSNPFDPITCSEHLAPTIIFQPTSPYPSAKGHVIAAPASMTLIVLSDGTVYGFGGHGDPNQGMFRGMCNSDLAIGGAIIPNLPTVEQVFAGTNHALFLTDNKEVWSLGANTAGQGGLGTTTIQECPHIISPTTVRGVSGLAAGNSHSLALIKGTLSLSSTMVDFGNQPFGTSSASPMNVTVTNTGLTSVTFYDINTSTTQDYSLSEDCPDSSGFLVAGAYCTLSINFAPSTPGRREDQIRIVHDGHESPHGIALTGIATEAEVAFSPTIINFGAQTVGTISPIQMVTIQNVGTAPLLIANIVTTAGFSIVTDSCNRTPNAIAIQGTCTVEIAFAPNVAGVATGKLRVTYEPSGKVAEMDLEGTGN